MSKDNATGWSGSYDDLPGASGRGHHQMAEGIVVFEGAPVSARDATMSNEIDAILHRLRSGVPELHREMDDLLTRVHRPGGL
jgi:hypothetical protein